MRGRRIGDGRTAAAALVLLAVTVLPAVAAGPAKIPLAPLTRVTPAPGGLTPLAGSPPPAPPAGSAPPGGLAPVPGTPPPYDDQLLRLSEILGSLQYLRQLCGSGEGTLWRDQMQDLIDSEQPDDTRKARFIDRFNHGYDSFRSVYRSCTPAAVVAIDRYMEEGAGIASDVAARYGREK